MAGASCRSQMVGGVPVISAPARIDITTAGQLSAAVLEAAACGYATAVVDMTGTRVCDPAVLRMLVQVHNRAASDGCELRLVIPAGAAVRLGSGITGIGQVLPHFTSLEEALPGVPAAAPRPSSGPGVPAADAPRPSSGPGAPAAGSRAEAWEQGRVIDTRACAQCGTAFVPQREHARFCTVGCRAAWNRQHMGDPAVEASALQWSVTAMSEAAGRLAGIRAWDQAGAQAAVAEAVWWITMVDATLVRHHRDGYDAVLAARGAAERRLTEVTLAGLRFVRNQLSRGAALEELIDSAGAGPGGRRITHWTWKPAPEPAPGQLPARGHAWEMARYRAYQAQLAGHTIGETFRRTVSFLTFAGANAASTMVTSADSGQENGRARPEAKRPRVAG